MIFGKQKFGVKQLKMNKFIPDVKLLKMNKFISDDKQLKMNKFTKSIWQLIISNDCYFPILIVRSKENFILRSQIIDHDYVIIESSYYCLTNYSN